MFKNGKLYPGATFQLTAEFQDDTGEYADPDSLYLKTVNPLGQETTYTFGTDDEVQQDDTGLFHADITPNMTGRWFFRWEANYTGGAVSVIEDSFIVQASSFSPYSYFGRRDYA